MLEVLKFIFSEWYIFLGVIILIGVVGEVIADIISSFKDKNTD